MSVLMDNSETGAGSPAGVIADLPQMLHARLVEEAHLKLALDERRRALETHASNLRRLEGGGFALGAVMGRLMKRAESPELTEARAKAAELRKAASRTEEAARRVSAEVETLADVYLADMIPEYPTYRDARKRLQAWEQSVAQLQTKLGKLIELLGQARNMASSGYDKKRQAISGTAKAHVERAIEAAKGVAKQVEATNSTAGQLGGLPEIRLGIRPDDLTRLERMDMGAMQGEFDRVITIFEDLQAKEIEGIKASGLGEADYRQQQAAAYLASYVEQIRRFAAEKCVVPADVDRVRQKVEARYLGG